MRAADEGKLRVLIVGPSPSLIGGQAVQAARLLDQLQREPSVDAQFLAVNPVLAGPLGALQRVKYVRTVVTSVAYWARLVSSVRRFDVLHVLSAAYWSFLLAPAPALAAASIFRRPAILNYRSGEAADHFGRSPLARKIAARFDRVVVPSGYLQDVFGTWGIRAAVVPNIVDFSRITFRRRAPLRPHFLSNRNLEPLYNVGSTLEAYRIIAREYPDAKLDVVGDGSERERLERFVRDASLPNVTFHGAVRPDRMADFLEQADIYLNSSIIDNMPTSLLEAQAAGLAVASSDAGGIPYIISNGETGLLVPKEQPNALAAAALRYLRDPDLAARITDAAHKSVEQYRAERVSAGWVEQYRAVRRSR